MARTCSLLTMGTAAFALCGLTLPAGAQQQQPGRDQGAPHDGGERSQGNRPQGDRPQAENPRGDRPEARGPNPPRDTGRTNPAGDQPQAGRPNRDRPSPSRPDAEPRPPAQHGGDRRPAANSAVPRETAAPPPTSHDPGAAPAPPRQQEAQRRQQQEQRWQEQRGGQRPIRQDVRDVAHRDDHGRAFQVPTNDRVHVVTKPGRFDWAAAPRRPFDGCPPGIANRYANCAPPALSDAAPNRWHQPGWYGAYSRDAGYRYADGYLLQLGPDSAVARYMPLLGGALAVGQPWPATYGAVALPDYYARYYDLGPASGYRYYDDVIYRVDPADAAITAVAALLSGTSVEIGRPMPAGYEIYNVPYRYRDQYFDRADALYRYSDGTIYQIDPATRLVQAAIELLA